MSLFFCFFVFLFFFCFLIKGFNSFLLSESANFYYISTSVYILNHFLLFLFTGYQSDEGCGK